MSMALAEWARSQANCYEPNIRHINQPTVGRSSRQPAAAIESARDRGLNKTDKLFVGRGAQPCAPTANAEVIKFLFLEGLQAVFSPLSGLGSVSANLQFSADGNAAKKF
ncbi:MAG: hypothetical protein H7Z11_07040 [Verrucomicrobia bacterium]|nr:hypothetical protein [Leptolyngbya sp. ES-bin-22]